MQTFVFTEATSVVIGVLGAFLFLLVLGYSVLGALLFTHSDTGGEAGARRGRDEEEDVKYGLQLLSILSARQNRKWQQDYLARRRGVERRGEEEFDQRRGRGEGAEWRRSDTDGSSSNRSSDVQVAVDDCRRLLPSTDEGTRGGRERGRENSPAVKAHVAATALPRTNKNHGDNNNRKHFHGYKSGYFRPRSGPEFAVVNSPRRKEVVVLRHGPQAQCKYEARADRRGGHGSNSSEREDRTNTTRTPACPIREFSTAPAFLGPRGPLPHRSQSHPELRTHTPQQSRLLDTARRGISHEGSAFPSGHGDVPAPPWTPLRFKQVTWLEPLSRQTSCPSLPGGESRSTAAQSWTPQFQEVRPTFLDDPSPALKRESVSERGRYKKKEEGSGRLKSVRAAGINPARGETDATASSYPLHALLDRGHAIYEEDGEDEDDGDDEEDGEDGGEGDHRLSVSDQSSSENLGEAPDTMVVSGPGQGKDNGTGQGETNARTCNKDFRDSLQLEVNSASVMSTKTKDMNRTIAYTSASDPVSPILFSIRRGEEIEYRIEKSQTTNTASHNENMFVRPPAVGSVSRHGPEGDRTRHKTITDTSSSQTQQGLHFTPASQTARAVSNFNEGKSPLFLKTMSLPADSTVTAPLSTADTATEINGQQNNASYPQLGPGQGVDGPAEFDSFSFYFTGYNSEAAMGEEELQQESSTYTQQQAQLQHESSTDAARHYVSHHAGQTQLMRNDSPQRGPRRGILKETKQRQDKRDLFHHPTPQEDNESTDAIPPNYTYFMPYRYTHACPLSEEDLKAYRDETTPTIDQLVADGTLWRTRHRKQTHFHRDDLDPRSPAAPNTSIHWDDLDPRSPAAPNTSIHWDDLDPRSPAAPNTSIHWDDLDPRTPETPITSLHWDDLDPGTHAAPNTPIVITTQTSVDARLMTVTPRSSRDGESVSSFTLSDFDFGESDVDDLDLTQGDEVREEACPVKDVLL